MRKLILPFGLTAALLASGLTAAEAAKRDNAIRFAYDQAPENVDPYFNNVRIGVIIGHHVWDTLVYRDPNTNEYKGQLASAWRQVDDKTIEFDLRQGVKFHNGEEFDADDVVYTLNFIAKPENKVVTQSNVNWIDRAEKLDKYKVRLITKGVFPAAIEYLSGPIAIHPNEYHGQVGAKGRTRSRSAPDPTALLSTTSASRSCSSAIRTTSRNRKKGSRRSRRSRSASSRTGRRSSRS